MHKINDIYRWKLDTLRATAKKDSLNFRKGKRKSLLLHTIDLQQQFLPTKLQANWETIHT